MLGFAVACALASSKCFVLPITTICVLVLPTLPPSPRAYSQDLSPRLRYVPGASAEWLLLGDVTSSAVALSPVAFAPRYLYDWTDSAPDSTAGPRKATAQLLDVRPLLALPPACTAADYAVIRADAPPVLAATLPSAVPGIYDGIVVPGRALLLTQAGLVCANFDKAARILRWSVVLPGCVAHVGHASRLSVLDHAFGAQALASIGTRVFRSPSLYASALPPLLGDFPLLALCRWSCGATRQSQERTSKMRNPQSR